MKKEEKQINWKKWDEIVMEYDDMFCHWDEFKEEVKQEIREGKMEVLEELSTYIDKYTNIDETLHWNTINSDLLQIKIQSLKKK